MPVGRIDGLEHDAEVVPPGVEALDDAADEAVGAGDEQRRRHRDPASHVMCASLSTSSPGRPAEELRQVVLVVGQHVDGEVLGPLARARWCGSAVDSHTA